MITILLIGLGLVFIILNSLSKQKQEKVCNRCGTPMLMNKCPKCGYTNYEHEGVKSNTFMTLIGVLLIIGGLVLIPYSFSKDGNEVFNSIKNTINNIVLFDVDEVEDNQEETNEPPIEDNPQVNTNTTEPSNNVTTNNPKPTKPTTPSYKVTTSGVGIMVNTCKINSFTGKVSSINDSKINFSYTINLTENTKPSATDNELSFKTCYFTIYLFDENNNLIAKWQDFDMLHHGETKNKNGFKFVEKAGYTYSAVLKAN